MNPAYLLVLLGLKRSGLVDSYITLQKNQIVVNFLNPIGWRLVDFTVSSTFLLLEEDEFGLRMKQSTPMDEGGWMCMSILRFLHLFLVSPLDSYKQKDYSVLNFILIVNILMLLLQFKNLYKKNIQLPL